MNIISSIKRLTFAFALGLFCTQCGTTMIGNPGAQDEIGLQVRGDLGSATTTGKWALTPRMQVVSSLSSARIVLSRIRFDSGDACTSSLEEENEIQFEGPYVVDLIANQSLPEIPKAKISSDTICRIRLKMEKLDKDELPSGLSSDDTIVENSFEVAGTSSGGVPFTIRLRDDEEFELGVKNGNFLIEGSQVFFLLFDLGGILNGVDLNSLEQTDHKIIIDKDNNKDAIEVIRDNIKTLSKLYKDSNSNGSFDAEDDSEDHVLTEH